MSFSDLYDRVQEETQKISSKWVRDQVIDLTHIRLVREQWTGLMDGTDMRGFYVEGPLGPPVPLSENEALIVLARDLSKPWRRFVYTKELMHAFDEAHEITDTSEKFDQQVERLGDPSKVGSPQFQAEIKALWRALSVLCPESYRVEQMADVDGGASTEAMVAVRLAIPEQYIRPLFKDNFLEIIESIK